MTRTPLRLYKTEAVVLRQRRLGEADRILTILTPAYGKMQVKAKGVRRTTSRMAGHLQPLTRCLVQLARGHANDVIAGCQTLDSFRPLRDDLDRLSRALYAAELVELITPEHAPAPATYRLLTDSLQRLAACEGDPDLVLRYLEMRLLHRAGFRPQLDRCVGCGGELAPEQNFFAPLAGGAVCSLCAAGARPLSLNGLKVLRLLQRAPYNEIARLKLPPALSQEVERHLHAYVVAVLERDVNAAAFIQRLRRGVPRQALEV